MLHLTNSGLTQYAGAPIEGQDKSLEGGGRSAGQSARPYTSGRLPLAKLIAAGAIPGVCRYQLQFSR